MNQRLTPDELYGVAKHRAVTLALMLSDMAADERIAPERFDTWCSALERRIEAQNVEIAALRKRLARLELAKDTP